MLSNYFTKFCDVGQIIESLWILVFLSLNELGSSLLEWTPGGALASLRKRNYSHVKFQDS